MTGNTEHIIEKTFCVSVCVCVWGGGGVIGRMNNMDDWKAKIQALI